MNRKLLLGLAGSVGAAALAVGIAIVPPSGSPEGPADTQSATYTESGETSVGIKVHGHWVIEIRNPDGSLVRRREFDNALRSLGADALRQLLARNTSVGRWVVSLHSLPGDHPCQSGETQVSCFIYESNALPSEEYDFKNLTVSIPTTGDNANKLVLSGSATASGGDISRVTVNLDTCSGDTSPADCAVHTNPIEEQYQPFTLTDITAETVEFGQSILVTVAIDFS